MRLIKLISLAALVGMVSCENTLDTTIWTEPTTVVYGMFCPADSIHNIRISRSFICEGNISEYAKIPDSLYYPEADVYIEAVTAKGDILQRIEMHQVELEEKEPGLFLRSPNISYQFSNYELIQPQTDIEDFRYVLTIFLADKNKAILAESLFPPLPVNLSPEPSSRPFEIQFYTQYDPIKFTWRRSLEFYIQLETKVNFLELRGDEWQPAFITQTRKYNHWDKPPINPTEEVIIESELFYSMLGGRIKDDPEVTSRKFQSIDFTLITSDPLFYDYFAYEHYLTDLAANTFTNVVNGIGIFAAYNRAEWKGYTIDQRSTDSLALGRHTKHLKFTRWQ